MICPFCEHEHENTGDRYGCPNCHGEGLENMNHQSNIKDARRHRSLYPRGTVMWHAHNAHAWLIKNHRTIVVTAFVLVLFGIAGEMEYRELTR